MNAHRKIIKDNARSLLKIIAKQYNSNYSSALFQILKEHPNAPSFLSLQYILQQMGKESFAMHVTYEELQNLPRPFIAHITTNVDLFLFITNITPDNVQMIDVEGNIETIDRTDFDHMWDGNILLIDEKQGNIKISFKEKFNTFINQIRFPFLILCIILSFIYTLISKQEQSILFYLYLIGILGGISASTLLFIEQIDKNNIHIKKLCSASGNKSEIDCSSILDFKDAYFLGLISWSDVGFVYFAFLLIVTLLFPFSISQIVINLFSILCIGYVCYSLYYQKYIAKKWCTLCLSVQIVFIYLFALSICTLNIKNIYKVIQPNNLLGLMITALTILSIYMIIKQLISTHTKHLSLQRKFNELIYDDNISQYLFSKEAQITSLNKVQKLSIGVPDAKTQLTLIFSPICASCIKELQILLPILHRKKDIQLELVFLLDREKHPESQTITKLLIQEYNNDPDKFSILLEDYVTKYPISKNKLLKEAKITQGEFDIEKLIVAQEEWCLNHKIYTTPTIFINGYKLPNYFSIKDIDYLY